MIAHGGGGPPSASLPPSASSAPSHRSSVSVSQQDQYLLQLSAHVCALHAPWLHGSLPLCWLRFGCSSTPAEVSLFEETLMFARVFGREGGVKSILGGMMCLQSFQGRQKENKMIEEPNREDVGWHLYSTVKVHEQSVEIQFFLREKVGFDERISCCWCGCL